MKSFLKEIDKKIYFGSAAIVIVMVLGLIFVPDFVQKAIYARFHIVIDKFGCLYILVSVFCFGLFFYIYFGKYGNIKLGRPEEKPRFSTFSWAAMIFTSGAVSYTHLKTFGELVKNVRMKKARTLLKGGNMTVESIADKVGYQNVEHFNRLFKKKYGMTPVQFRNSKS